MKEKVTKSVKENKKKLVIQIIVILVLAITAGVIVHTSLSHADPNTASFLKDQQVEGLNFTRTEYENNTLKVMVENTLVEEYVLSTIDVTFLDQDGNEITTITGYIGHNIKVGDRKQLVVSTDIDLSQASSIRYTINRED